VQSSKSRILSSKCSSLTLEAITFGLLMALDQRAGIKGDVGRLLNGKDANDK